MLNATSAHLGTSLYSCIVGGLSNVSLGCTNVQISERSKGGRYGRWREGGTVRVPPVPLSLPPSSPLLGGLGGG